MSKFVLSIDTSSSAVDMGKPLSPAHFIALSPRSMLPQKKNGKSKSSWSSNQRQTMMKNISFKHLCEKQKQSVELVRAGVEQELNSTPKHEEVIGVRRIMRFLRGHKYDVETATAMYGNMLRWRNENNISKIRNEIVEKGLQPKDFPHHERILKFYPSMLHFTDDINGRPIHIDLIGRMEPKKLLSCFSSEEWLEHHIYCMEYNSLMVDNLSKKSDKLVRIVSIYDLEGLNMSSLHKPTMDLLKKTVKLTQDFYPEMMDQCFVVNAPKIFTACWTVVKPLLAERTVKKIQILGKNSYSSLIDTIGIDNLPEAFGGNKSHIGTPLRFEKNNANTEDYKKITVPKSKTEAITFNVNANSFIVWGFFTESGEVGFQINFQDDSGKESVLYDWRKCESLGGSYQTKASGTLCFIFDNKSSWVNKKVVNYYFQRDPM